MIIKRFWQLILVFGVAAILTVNSIWFPGQFIYYGFLGKILSSSLVKLIFAVGFAFLGAWSAKELKKRD